MEKEEYKVRIANFEGPFGLLLSLIEEKKLFINEISLTEVTEDYLKYLNDLNEKDHSEVSNFLVIAATLVLLKSRSLLPNINLTPEEEKDIHNLEERLKLYELYTKLSLNIRDNFGKKIIFLPEERKNNFSIFLPGKEVTKENLLTYAHLVLDKIPKKTFLQKVEVKKVISLEEVIDKLTKKIEEGLKMNFNEFSGTIKSKEDKVVVIISFLAMLELVRQGLLEAVQEDNFRDIIIEKQDKDTENLVNE